MTSTGTGNLTHVAGELFKMMADVDLVHVPGHGEMQAQSDLLAGRVDVMFDPIVSSLGYLKAGQLRALAVTGKERVDKLPGVPTVAEFVPGYEVYGRLGVGAPKDMPAAVVDYLNGKINAALADPAIVARLADFGFAATPMSPAQFGTFVADETEKWAKVIKAANVKAE
jgi:tripartite-type tricarboxylate transporter receptor subunit TctC